ncbi:MAG: hypothetical protein CFH41_00197 [Alphaproteobacteria bacterium MarineAlpha11_Bin1]|nr:MAG: hypothetical protein CFH41_00197 [Alphaproteobacteria bacterium MarineAlpha11_Bin1]|tara:strand:- start:3485 stop:4816 length:1332 start_codon:yes stop_codon:yes gene_type:complete
MGMTEKEAFIAANRFGLGSDPEILDKIGRDARGWLINQLHSEDDALNYLNGLPASSHMISEFLRVRRDANRRQKFNKERAAPLYRTEIYRRTVAAVKTETPFRERLVRFWSNHFTISITVSRLRSIAGAYEREAIRPHVTGRFVDLLTAVTRHPTMLIYLDNVQSTGPNSSFGRRRRRGLNENLAREILELHTLGAGGGYTQKDVTEFAKILTGWRFRSSKFDDAGNFAFAKFMHEPGPKTLLGKTYLENGVNEGIQALQVIARHPATAKFVATKLARHFISDTPPAEAVEKLSQIFIESDGDLTALSQALVVLPYAWKEPFIKIKTPAELSISAFRLLGVPGRQKQAMAPFRLLGQMPFSAPSPAGWPDTAEDWISPESMIRRIQLMQLLVNRLQTDIDPRALARDSFGPVISENTRLSVERAESRKSALAILLSAPEFQRR